MLSWRPAGGGGGGGKDESWTGHVSFRAGLHPQVTQTAVGQAGSLQHTPNPILGDSGGAASHESPCGGKCRGGGTSCTSCHPIPTQF